MSEMIALLDDTTQAGFQDALERAGEKELGTPEELGPRRETLAALAILGRQPTEIQPATLTIMPIGIRHELLAYGYAEASDTDEVRWRLTADGVRTASLLASTVAPRPAAEQNEAQAKLDTLLDEVRDDLGPIE